MAEIATQELTALKNGANIANARGQVLSTPKTPTIMKALNVQQEINQDAIRQITELNLRIETNETARRDDTRRLEGALNEVRDKISQSNEIAERTATASEIRTKIAQDLLKLIKWFAGVAVPGIPAAAYSVWG